MAGHSKWANIKHRKSAQDKKRSKLFSRIIKELTVAAKEGGEDPDANPRLRLAIQNAKGANMPKDTIERAIKKASDADASNFDEVYFEGYAPHGVAIFIEATTDNNNRTVSSIRSIFNKYDGSLSKSGSVEFLFERKGVFTIKKAAIANFSREEIELKLIEGGAEEFDYSDDLLRVYTHFEDYGNMQNTLESLQIEPLNTALVRIPLNSITLDVEQAQTVLQVIEKLEDDDDVNEVFHNLELTQEIQQMLEQE